MIPVRFAESNTVFAENQPQYQPLPAHVPLHDPQGVVTTCWKLTWREWWTFLWTGRIWLQQMTFCKPLQPQLPNIQKPTLPQ